MSFTTCQLIVKSRLKNKLPKSFDFPTLRKHISDSTSRCESACVLRRIEYTAKLTKNLFLKVFIKKRALFNLSSETWWNNEIIQHISFLIESYAHFTPVFTQPIVDNLQGIIPLSEIPKVSKLFFIDITSDTFINICTNIDLFITVTGETKEYRIYLKNSNTSAKVGQKHISLCSNSFANAQLICDKIVALSELL